MLCFHHYSGSGGSLVTKLCLTLATPWAVARQAPLSMEFFRQEYGMGCSFPLQGIFPCRGKIPHAGVKPTSPALQADSFKAEPPGKPLELILVALFNRGRNRAYVSPRDQTNRSQN